MYVHLGKVLLDVLQQFFVPFELEIGMETTLQQNLVATQLNRFLNLGQQYISFKDVALSRFWRAVRMCRNRRLPCKRSCS